MESFCGNIFAENIVKNKVCPRPEEKNISTCRESGSENDIQHKLTWSYECCVSPPV